MTTKISQSDSWELFKENYPKLVKQVDVEAETMLKTTQKLKNFQGAALFTDSDIKEAITLAKNILNQLHVNIPNQNGVGLSSITLSINNAEKNTFTIYSLFKRIGLDIKILSSSSISIMPNDEFASKISLLK